MPVQPQTFTTRLLSHSTLSPQARLVAMAISHRRYQKRLKPHEPLPLTLEDLAQDCGMSRRSVIRYLDECLAAGWIAGRAVFRDGRQKPNEYYLADPTDEAECTRLHSVMASGGRILSAGVAHNSRRRLHTVVRSNNNGAGDDAAPRGGGGSDGQGTPPTAEAASADAPAPALGASADTPAEHLKEDPARRSALTRALWQRGMTREEYGHLPPGRQQQLEQELLDDWQAQHRDKRAGLESPADGLETPAEPPMHIPPARLTNPLHHRCPDCHAPIGRRCHQPSGYHGSRRRLAEAAALQPA